MHNYQPKNLPPSSQVFSQSDLPHNVRLQRFFVLSCFAMTSNTARGIKDVCSITWKILAQIWRNLKRKISATCCFTTRYADFGGERGIRTPGTLRYAGFQDRCIRPLYHLSLQMVAVVFGLFASAKVGGFIWIAKFMSYFFRFALKNNGFY